MGTKTKIQLLLQEQCKVLFFTTFLYLSCNRTLFSGSNARYGVLDGVRSLSVLWVLLVHSFVNYPVPNNQLNNSFWVRFIANGVYGVDSFFVLSGFLMYLYLWVCFILWLARYHILHKEFLGKGTINVPRFYLRRWLRLSPAYPLFLALLYFNLITLKVFPLFGYILGG